MKRVLLAAVVSITACFGTRTPEVVPSVPVASLPGHGGLVVDTSPKEGLRMVPPEAYVRTYLQLFGGLAPLAVQKKAKGADGAQLFDVWSDYLATLGFPDDKQDLPRATQTNALMVATFERLGAALCDRAVENDLRGGKKPLNERVIFAFEGAATDLASFTARFDVLHKTFLGYPESLAPGRAAKFHKLFTETVARHASDVKPKLTPEETGWAVVCEGLVRHPEFQLY
jgi:hypothetical protein